MIEDQRFFKMKLPDRWRWMNLGDLVCFVNGDRGKNYPATSSRVDVGVPFINTGHIEPTGRLSRERMNYISRYTFERLGSGKVEQGDIVYCLRGSTGKVARNDYREGAIASSLIIIRTKNPYIRSFIYHYLASPIGQSLARQFDNGSAQPNLSARVLSQYPVPLPSEGQLVNISQILDSLDDKIELNRQMNATLEAMARTIFKDWFVDFGPTRAKMEGRAAYLAPDIWSLFPDKLDEEGKPIEWVNRALGEVSAEIRRGLSPSYLETGGIRVVNQKCIRDRRVDSGAARRHDPQKRSIEGRELKEGDILVNSTGVGTLGRVAQIWTVDEPTILDSHVTLVRADPARISSLCLGLNLAGRESEIEALGEGSTGQTELSRIRLSGLSILIPAQVLQTEFDSAVRPLVDMTTANSRQNEVLAATRDLLLPKLMTGEIRVKDAEDLVGTAA